MRSEIERLTQVLVERDMQRGIAALRFAADKYGMTIDHSGPLLARLVRAALHLVDAGHGDEASICVTLLYELLNGDMDPMEIYTQFGEEVALLAAALDRYVQWADGTDGIIAHQASNPEAQALLKAVSLADGVRNNARYLDRIAQTERAARIETTVRLHSLHFRANLLSHMIGYARHTRLDYLPFVQRCQDAFPTSRAFFEQAYWEIKSLSDQYPAEERTTQQYDVPQCTLCQAPLREWRKGHVCVNHDYLDVGHIHTVRVICNHCYDSLSDNGVAPGQHWSSIETFRLQPSIITGRLLRDLTRSPGYTWSPESLESIYDLLAKADGSGMLLEELAEYDD